MPHEAILKPSMNPRARALLWLDGSAALTAGLLVLVLNDWLSLLHAFPERLVLFIGLSNLAYATYSGTLATLASTGKTPSARAVALLVIANGIWVLVCSAMLASTWQSATMFGLAHVALEALFVGSLAIAEYHFVLKRGHAMP